MFGLEKFVGVVGVTNLLFCVGVAAVVLILPFFAYRIHGKMKPKDKPPA